MGREFYQLALTGVMAAPFIEGALETLEQLKKKGIPVFVVSGTPDEEIKVIVEKKNLAHYFLEVHGSSRKKRKYLVIVKESEVSRFPEGTCVCSKVRFYTPFSASVKCVMHARPARSTLFLT